MKKKGGGLQTNIVANSLLHLGVMVVMVVMVLLVIEVMVVTMMMLVLVVASSPKVN